MLYITPRFPHTHILKMLNAFLFPCFARVGPVADAIDVQFNQQLRKRKFLQLFSFMGQCLFIAYRMGKRTESNLAEISHIERKAIPAGFNAEYIGTLVMAILSPTIGPATKGVSTSSSNQICCACS